MRPGFERQIAERRLVCPKTRQPLILKGDRLVTEDGEISYPLIDGVPILLSAERSAAYLSSQGAAMASEYERSRPGALRSLLRSLEGAVGDLRTAGSQQAFAAIFEDLPPDALDHYQNFTATGHRRLFERAGFEVLAAGTCVGPTFALRDLAINYLRSVLPGGRIGKLGARLLALLTLPLLWLDRWANGRPRSADLASTTYLDLRKAARR